MNNSEQSENESRRTAPAANLGDASPEEGLPSCVFVTTPTSGTGSLWRIINALGKKYARKEKIAEMYETQGRIDELPDWRPQLENEIYLYNTPHIVNRSLLDSRIRLIINFRDPRDLSCNQYFWALQHPILGKGEEETERFREKVRSGGIDRYVLSVDNCIQFRLLRVLEERLRKDQDHVLILSYSELCLDFDHLIGRLARFFALSPEEVPWDLIERERTAKLAANPSWIGQVWSGTDTSPGRYKHELQASTIQELDVRYAEILEFLRHLERPEFRHLLATSSDN